MLIVMLGCEVVIMCFVMLLSVELGYVVVSYFLDGEFYVWFYIFVYGVEVVIVCMFDYLDEKLLLLFWLVIVVC